MRKWGLCMYATLVSYIEVLRGSDEEAHRDESRGTIREKAGPLHLHSGVRSSSGPGDAWLAKTRSKKSERNKGMWSVMLRDAKRRNSAKVHWYGREWKIKD
jgi:hypothetical protein